MYFKRVQFGSARIASGSVLIFLCLFWETFGKVRRSSVKRTWTWEEDLSEANWNNFFFTVVKSKYIKKENEWGWFTVFLYFFISSLFYIFIFLYFIKKYSKEIHQIYKIKFFILYILMLVFLHFYGTKHIKMVLHILRHRITVIHLLWRTNAAHDIFITTHLTINRIRQNRVEKWACTYERQVKKRQTDRGRGY